MFEALDEKFNTTTQLAHHAPDAVVLDDEMDTTDFVEVAITEDTLDDDVALARRQIKNTLDVAEDAIRVLANIAKTSESARSFEVLSQLLKTVSDTSKDLIQLHKMREDTRKKSGKTDAQKNVTNNNVFVGSTHDLMRLLKEHEES